MKVLFIFTFVFISHFAFSQTSDNVLKFECEARMFENLVGEKEQKISPGYRLLVIDFNKSSVDIYPDSIRLDMTSKITFQAKTGNLMILEFKCIDHFNRICTAELSYRDDKPFIFKITWKKFHLLYFLTKRKQ